MITKRFFVDDSVKDPDFDSTAYSSDSESEKEINTYVFAKARLPSLGILPTMSYAEPGKSSGGQQSNFEPITQDKLYDDL